MTSEAENCCSHLKVVYKPFNNLDRTKSPHWECVDCGTPFTVLKLEVKDRLIAEKDAEIERLKQERDMTREAENMLIVGNYFSRSLTSEEQSLFKDKQKKDFAKFVMVEKEALTAKDRVIEKLDAEAEDLSHKLAFAEKQIERLKKERDMARDTICVSCKPAKEKVVELNYDIKELTEQLQVHKDALKVAIEFIDYVTCVHNTLMEIRAREKARTVKTKLNELIGED